AADGSNDLLAQTGSGHVSDTEGTAFAITLNDREDVHLHRLMLCVCAVFHLAADHGFVSLDSLSFATNRLRARRRHRLADTMRHEPCGTVGTETEHSLKLQRADAFLAGGNDVHCQQPLVERDMRALVDRAGANRELEAAIVA